MNEIELLKIFGENVRQQRIEKKLSILEVSKITKLSKRYLQKIEDGQALELSISEVIILALALKINPSDLCKNISRGHSKLHM